MGGFISTTTSLSEILTNSSSVQSAALATPISEMIGVAADTVLKFKAPCEAIDQLALNAFNEIIQKQSSIISLGGNVGLASECYSSDTAVLTTIYGSLVSGIAVTYGTSLGISNIPFNSTISYDEDNNPVIETETTQVVAYGILKYDTLEAFRYPNMETSTLNSSTDNPLDGGGYVTLTSGNLGIGKETKYTVRAGAGSIVFAFQSSGCAAYTGITNSISSLRSQYTAVSSGIATYISPVNVVKGIKNSAQLEYWSLNKVSTNSSDGISSNSSTLTLLNNPDYGGPY